MDKQCHSCAMPLTGAANPEADLCQYCTDEQGNLKKREEVQAGIAQWLQSWGPDKSADYTARAADYMKAMPAWSK